jgi:hypothetical protein
MSLQRPTTGVCHVLLRILTQSGPTSSAEVSHTKWSHLHHVVQTVHKECRKDESQRHELSSLNRARYTDYSIPN